MLPNQQHEQENKTTTTTPVGLNVVCHSFNVPSTDSHS